ncbi:MAG: His-Xaa-Ser system protein HxsD [Candidatus Omnitrophota bacterium]
MSKYAKKEQEFLINPRIYPLEAIYATCYVFVDRYYLFLDEVRQRIKIVFTPKASNRRNHNLLKGEFLNELLNNTLRFKISKRNQRIREMIVKEALFFSQPKKEIDGVVASEEKTNQSWQNDPEGIAIPWEEKYKRKKSR